MGDREASNEVRGFDVVSPAELAKPEPSKVTTGPRSLDSYVVRTMVVRAFAALVGPRLWWPAKVSA